MAFAMKSRCGRRCARLCASLPLPERSLLLAGAIGGPLCFTLLTPLRNALTLASCLPEYSAAEVYAAVFDDGLAHAWTGGMLIFLTSSPPFLVMGPLFHLLQEGFGACFAVLLAGIGESLLTYGPQTATAQMAFNAGHGTVQVASVFWPLGPGVVYMTLRNCVAMSGIRILSRPLQAVMRRAMCSIGIKVPDLAVSFAGDFWASVVTSILSAPMNQLYSFAIISTEYHAAAPLQKLVVAGRFLSESYLTWAEDGSLVGLSSTFFRDLFMRCLYLATLMSLFAVVERMCVTLSRGRVKKRSSSSSSSSFGSVADLANKAADVESENESMDELKKR
ncbi:unnamed protein product [Effrenium voratum]|nr:unnamed protein product [Effrenium voratum]